MDDKSVGPVAVPFSSFPRRKCFDRCVLKIELVFISLDSMMLTLRLIFLMQVISVNTM